MDGRKGLAITLLSISRLFIIDVVNMKEIIQTTIENSQKESNNYTYPIFVADENGKPDLLASSVVIEVDDKAYLVTASHVLKEVMGVGGGFLIGVNTQYLTINGEFTYSESNSTDEFDIAFVELQKDFIETNKIEVLPYENLAISPLNSKPHIAFAHGFPNSKNKQSKALRQTAAFKVKAYAFAGVIREDVVDWPKYDKDENVHVCMSYGKKSDKSIPTHPRGISGGGLWVVPNILTDPKVKLHGVFIEYYKNDEISFSTEIGQVVDFIRST